MSIRSICLCDHCVKFRSIVYIQRWSGKECRCLYKEGDGWETPARSRTTRRRSTSALRL